MAPKARASSVTEAPRSVRLLNMMMGTRELDLAQLADGFQSVHLRHFKIQQNNVGLQGGEFRQRHAPVDRRTRDFKIGVLRNGHDSALRTTTASSTSSTRFFLVSGNAVWLPFATVIFRRGPPDF